MPVSIVVTWVRRARSTDTWVAAAHTLTLEGPSISVSGCLKIFLRTFLLAGFGIFLRTCLSGALMRLAAGVSPRQECCARALGLLLPSFLKRSVPDCSFANAPGSPRPQVVEAHIEA